MIRSPFNITREEGTKRIHNALVELNKIEPSIWGAELLNLVKPEDSDDEVVIKLIQHLPIIDKPFKFEVPPRTLLSWVCYMVEMALNNQQCLAVLSQRMRLLTYEIRLFLHYANALKLIYTVKTSNQVPTNIEDNLEFLRSAILEVYGAEVENYRDVEGFFYGSKQFLNDSILLGWNPMLHLQQIEADNFIEEQALEYAAQNINEIATQSMKQLIIEKMVLLQQSAYKSKGEKPPSGFERKSADNLGKLWRKRTAEKISLTPGGNNRKSEGFWSDERKIEFYRAVENLPKVKPKSLKGKKPEVSFWEYALDKLIEDDFDSHTINLLKTHRDFRGKPTALLDKAIKTWRKYLSEGDWNEIRVEEKPRAFEYQHALHLLEFPTEAAYSSLETYYYKGKKLSENQNQT